MSLVRVVEPATDPITPVEAKRYLRFDLTDEDELLEELIESATAYFEDRTGRQVVPATWALKLDSFPAQVIELTRIPVISVSSVTYVDTNGETQTVDPATYELDTSSLIARLSPIPGAYWPSTAENLNAVTVTFIAGYNVIPKRIKLAIKLLVAHWFLNRPDSTPVPPSLDYLVNQFWNGVLA